MGDQISNDQTKVSTVVPIAFCGAVSQRDRKVLLHPFWAHWEFAYLFGGIIWLSVFAVLDRLNSTNLRVFVGLLLGLIVGLVWRHVVFKKLRNRLQKLDLPDSDIDTNRFIVIADPQ